MSEVLVNSHSSELSPGTLPPSIKWMWLSGCSQQGREVRQRSAIRSQTGQQTQEGLGGPSVPPQPRPPRLYFSPPTPGWALGWQEVKWRDVCSVLKELVADGAMLSCREAYWSACPGPLGQVGPRRAQHTLV